MLLGLIATVHIVRVSMDLMNEGRKSRSSVLFLNRVIILCVLHNIAFLDLAAVEIVDILRD